MNYGSLKSSVGSDHVLITVLLTHNHLFGNNFQGKLAALVSCLENMGHADEYFMIPSMK